MQCRVSKSAFTLIELLLTIVIGSVLILSLVFAVGRVREQADQVQGAGGMRNLITAVLLYVGDHNGTLPGPMSNQQWIKRPDANRTQFVWKLHAYLGESGAPQPGQIVTGIAPRRFLRDYDPAVVSPYFAVNNIFYYRDSGALVRHKPWGATGTTYSDLDRTPKRLLSIPEASRRVAIIDLDAELMSDNNTPVAGTGPTVVSSPLYGTHRNAAFWDGRVEALPLNYDLWTKTP